MWSSFYNEWVLHLFGFMNILVESYDNNCIIINKLIENKMTTELLSIQEAYMNMYGKSEILTERVHEQIQDIMDSDKIPSKNKLSAVSKKAKELIKGGTDTGLESDKPKKGSSRAVFFPKDHKEIDCDGIKTKTPTAVKIAFAGQLDKHHGEDTTLGEDQNKMESDHYINNHYGILKPEPRKLGIHSHYVSSKHESGGVLAPIFSTHEDHHHLEMGRVTPANTKDIAEATQHKDYPKGLKHDEIYDAMGHEHASAHGQHFSSKHSNEHLEHIKEHPWVEHAISMMHDSGMHPGDLAKRNVGIYHHPVTGKKHLAIIDYGFSADIAKKYTKARINAAKLRREY